MIYFPNNGLHGLTSSFLGRSRTTQKKPTFVLFDTAQRERYAYDPLIKSAENNNFLVKYYSIDQIIDTPIENIPLDTFDCSCFVLSPEFLRSVSKINDPKKSLVTRKFLAIINLFSRMRFKMTFFLFPSRMRYNLESVAPLFTNFLHNPTRRFNRREPHMNTPNFRQIIANFLQRPTESRQPSYDTTLRTTKKDTNFHNRFRKINFLRRTSARGDTSNAQFDLLPMNQNKVSPSTLASSDIKNFFPLGVYYFNRAQRNHLVVSSAAILASGIHENFLIYPIKKSLQDQFHLALNEMMSDLHHKISGKQKNTFRNNYLPGKLFPSETKNQKNSQNPPKKIAWMEIKIFNPKLSDQKSLEKQKELINYILDAELTSMWISLNPHEIYSPAAKSTKSKRKILPQKKETFWGTISNFTKKLKTAALEKKVTPPPIDLGFEIANNLYKENLPKEPGFDIYGNKYFDIPRPLDTNFWKNEVEKPFLTFIEKWKKEEISNGIKLAGVALDLEMYGRKTTSNFSPVIGFEPKTIKAFLDRKNNFLQNTSTENKVSPSMFEKTMIEDRLAADYFSYLENEAKNLGKYLRKIFDEKIPNGKTKIYLPSISTDWFYKGFCAGLSTKGKPISLLTFNIEFAKHKKWFEKNKIYAEHLSVLMLSKIKKVSPSMDAKNISIINDLLKDNDGIWINRFSRLTDPQKNDWTFLENTPLNKKERAIFVKKLKKIGNTKSRNLP